MTNSFDAFDRRKPPVPGAQSTGFESTPRRRLHDNPEPAAPNVGTGSTSPYARFIPREEVRSFEAWAPDSFGGTRSPNQAAAAPPPITPEKAAEMAQAARQSGYQDGYRDGLVALEGFKQSYAQQVTAQMAQVTEAYRQRLEQLEAGLADHVAMVALALARQVVRSELTTRRELVAVVAQEALAGTLGAAKQVELHVNPEDHALIAAHAGDALAARGARLMPDAAVSRGGCIVDTDVGVIDASIEARWRRASELMGRPSELDADDEGRARRGSDRRGQA